MWYLIVPPIVVIISVLFLLWYLSKKGSDPFIIEKVSHIDVATHKEVSFFRTKKFLLHILEKMVCRFKIRSLQIHNILSSTTQSLKEKSKDLQIKKKREEESKIEVSKDTLLFEDPLSPSRESLSEETVSESVPSPQTPDRFSAFRKRTHQSFETSDPIPDRPMVSEEIVHPEVSYRKIATNVIHEESLIAHIATNPKDFSSYEKLGDYYLAVGNIKDAKECYKQVLKLSPAARLVKIKIRRLEKIISEKR